MIKKTYFSFLIFIIFFQFSIPLKDIQIHSEIFGQETEKKTTSKDEEKKKEKDNKELEKKKKKEEKEKKKQEEKEKKKNKNNSKNESNETSQDTAKKTETSTEVPETEYDKKVKKDLLKVFQFESNKNTKQLENVSLYNPAPRVRVAAVSALGRLKSGQFTLQKVIDQDGEQVRQEAYRSLANIGSIKSLRYFTRGARSSDKEIKLASYIGLGKTRESIARKILVEEGLKSDDESILKVSLESIGYFSNPNDIPVLKKYINSTNTNVKSSAIIGLGNHNTVKALNILREEYVTNYSIKEEFLSAIAKHTSLQSTFTLIKFLDDEKENKAQSEYITNKLKEKHVSGKFFILKKRSTDLHQNSNIRSKMLKKMELNEVGKINYQTDKLFFVEINGELKENYFFNTLVESSKDNSILKGWIFGEGMNFFEFTNNDKTVKNRKKVTRQYSSYY